MMVGVFSMVATSSKVREAKFRVGEITDEINTLFYASGIRWEYFHGSGITGKSYIEVTFFNPEKNVGTSVSKPWDQMSYSSFNDDNNAGFSSPSYVPSSIRPQFSSTPYLPSAPPPAPRISGNPRS